MKKLIALIAAILFALSVFAHDYDNFFFKQKGDTVCKWEYLQTGETATIKVENQDVDEEYLTGNVYKLVMIAKFRLVGIRSQDFLSDTANINLALRNPNTVFITNQIEKNTVDQFLLGKKTVIINSYSIYNPTTKTMRFWQEQDKKVSTEYMWARLLTMIFAMFIGWVFFASNPMANIINNHPSSIKLILLDWEKLMRVYFLSLPLLWIVTVLLLYNVLLFEYKSKQLYEFLIVYIGSVSWEIILFFILLFLEKKKVIHY